MIVPELPCRENQKYWLHNMAGKVNELRRKGESDASRCQQHAMSTQHQAVAILHAQAWSRLPPYFMLKRGQGLQEQLTCDQCTKAGLESAGQHVLEG